MTTQSEIRKLVDDCRKRGAILRTRVAATGEIEAISIGKRPCGQYRKLGDPGAGWLPLIAAAEQMREMLQSEATSEQLQWKRKNQELTDAEYRLECFGFAVDR